MYKFIFRLETLLILFFSTAYSSDSLKTEKTPLATSTSQDSILIPTYERYKFTRNYIFNQTVLNSIRWATILAAAGATGGAIVDAQEKYIFIPSSFIYGITGSGLGFITGTVIGIVNGLTLQKHTDSDFHKRRCKTGYEINIFDVAPIAGSEATRMSNPGFSLVYRTLSSKRFVPDEISLGLGNNKWYRSDTENTSTLRTSRIEGIVQFNFTSGKLLIPYWSFGAGYCWGEETGEYRHNDNLWYIEEHDIRSPLVRTYAGSELNVFDFFYGDLKIGYEIIGPYIFAHDKKNYPYSQNIFIGLSIGTYIF